MQRWLAMAVAAMLLGLSACEAPEPQAPAGFDTPAARAEGRRLFLAHCALCHGERADGHGLRRRTLSGPPADFTDPSWRERSSPERTFRIIRHGVRGTSMPAWRALDDTQVWSLVAYLRSVGERAAPPERSP